MALLSSLARSCVVAASKNNVSSLFFSAALRSVVQRFRPCALASRLELFGVAPDKDRVGHHPVAVLERNAALCADRHDRADKVLVHAHASGDAVHDDAEPLLRHGVVLLVSTRLPGAIPCPAADRCAVVYSPNFSFVFMSSVRGCGRSTLKLSAMRAGPAVSTITRVPRNTASVMPWVTNTIVFCDFCQMRNKFDVHLLARQRVERAERLVHQDKFWIVHKRARNGRALLHAAGKFVRIFLLVALEAHQRDEIDARARDFRRAASPGFRRAGARCR